MRVDPVTVKFEEPEEKLILAVDSDGGIIPEDSPDAT